MTAPTRCGAALRGLGGLLIVSAMGSIVAGAAQDPSAVLGGVVLAADQSGEPLAHAVVSLLDPANPVRVTVIAGDDGRFEFKDLRPGRYTVRASKPAYLPMAYGARRPGEAGTAIALTAGQRLDDLRITLTRGAIIAGHVRDPGGAPAANIPVVIAPAIATSGPGE